MTEEKIPKPMSYTMAKRLLHPLRGLILSPSGLVSRINPRPDATVLELGPGPGYFSPGLAKAVPRGRLVLVDVQQEMLDLAKERLTRAGLKNVEFRQGDATAIPAQDKAFDLALVVSMLGEVPDRQACLAELRRVLKPGGLLSVTEHKVRDPDFIPLEEMKNLVQAGGFRMADSRKGLFTYTLNFVKPA